MTLLLWGMVLALLVPITVMVRPIPAWDRLAAFASVSTKVVMIILVVVKMQKAGEEDLLLPIFLK